jgi:dihydrofolate reductase
MRKLVVLTFLSLDGIMQAPGGPQEDLSGDFTLGGWTFPLFDETLGAAMTAQMGQPFDLLLGHRTFDIFASYWPQQDPTDRGTVPLNKATKYVVSHEPITSDWQTTISITGDVVAEIRKLKNSDGPMLQVHGSGNLIQTLLAHDLVDELWLKTFPVTIGKGKRLFGEGTQPAAFKLIESTVSPSGVIMASYARDGEVKTGSF